MKLALLVGLAALASAAPTIPVGARIGLFTRDNWGNDGHDGKHDGGGWKGGDGHDHDGWKGDGHGDHDGHDGHDGGDGGKGPGGRKNCLARRNGVGMGHLYSRGWDKGDDKWDGHDGGHDGGHKGGHGGHGGNGGHGGHGGNGGHGGGHDDCPDPNSEDETADWILDNPAVRVNVTLPLRDVSIPLIDVLLDGLVPIINRTAPILDIDLGDLPALKNSSSPATTWGGILSQGMNATFRPVQGTNRNAFVFGSVVSESGLGPRKRQVAINTQPALPPAGTCVYEYQHVLGGDGSASRGALWALENVVDLVAADVQQGGIGDCGMGAAIMALASGGWTSLIKNSFVRVGQGEGSYEVLLKKDGVTQRIAIDDQLPSLTNANPMCWPYPGFQPVLDAALPGPLGNYPPTPIFFMPLFEKAFAKFLDANPDWKSTLPNVTGYAGLEGVNPAYVLAAITGGTPVSVWRTRPGFDGPILSALLTCMRGTAPCAISTGNATTLEGLGTPDAGTIWLNPAGDAAMPRGYTPGDTSGMLASDAPGSPSTFTVIDFDQVNETPAGDRSTVLTFVGNHAYGFDHSRSTDFPLPANINSLLNVRMSALNPWGANPCQWPGGGCGDGDSEFDEPSELPFSFRTLAMSIVGVFTVTMPASS
ncbi:hypothetical protein CC85DRAFT_313985 [Cutaneotrichosporon oleaginosum]|uniref:Calpain catalytic domain-containing protein n=1 Tax=Cutaneotrichosporon oleaginosum TaxID=879819 RepID=A0A0J0XDN4_9TREE|nr:uncharacterized protein CC85DRAFT_313985 [Cutaneotrichosporon oleaginosum]KLT39215.1 hypothetical protein CC85DRAFT_313985 [Cutaneotrichosporon oleaginosum]TXT05708.1 hypothetical protein COLE_07028 [Cutaneotrichosporon oleaginosum]